MTLPLIVKLGGTEGVDFSAACRDICTLHTRGVPIVFMHGGSAEATKLGQAVGHPAQFVTSPSGFTSRFTDRQTLEVFLMAVNGKVNSLLVEQLRMLGINAFGMSGLDGGLIQARRKATVRIIHNGKKKVLRGDFTGKIQSVNVSLLQMLLSAGCLPVIAPIAVGESGEALNVDADRAAANVAAALGAHTLILLTAAPGLLREFPDESSLISALDVTNLDEVLNFAQGRIKKKVLGTQEALQGGLKRVIIADGRAPHPVTSALSGAGTHIFAVER